MLFLLKAMKCWFVGVYYKFVNYQISVLCKLRCLDPEKSNIVQWYEHFCDKGNNCLVFEQLDKSLNNLMVERKWKPLHIKEIRPIVQQVWAKSSIYKHQQTGNQTPMLQVAKALSYLKTLQLIHGDIKLHNIMLVNHEVEPFRIKLIDFGLTYNASATFPGHILQTLPYRSVLDTGMNFNSARASATKVYL